jgi:hypothetical protein
VKTSDPHKVTIEPEHADEFRGFRHTWFIARDDYLAASGLAIAFVCNTVIIAVMAVYGASHPLLIGIGHGTVEALLLGWVIARLFKPGLTGRWLAVVLELVIVVTYGINLHLNWVEVGLTPYLVPSTSAYFGISMVFMLMLPVRFRARLLVACIYFGIAVAAWHEGAIAVKWLSLYAMLQASVIAYAWLFDERTDREVMREFLARKAIARVEQLTREKDLLLAREVQESLLPPASLQVGDVLIESYQAKAEQVCGDWIGVKQLGESRALAVVADAAGKGVHAALVVQAVQALFVGAGTDVDVEKWIRQVNEVLVALGTKKPQTMTLGVVDLNGNEVTYWSAGHLPLLARSAELYPERRAHSRLLMARGDVLGMDRAIALEPAKLTLPTAADVELLLASDGVLVKGARYSDAEVGALFASLAREGAGLVKLPWSTDDKSLIHVQVRRAAPGRRAG